MTKPKLPPYVSLKVTKMGGRFYTQFSIGVQTFTIDNTGATKEDVYWMRDRLKEALQDLYNQAYEDGATK